VATARQLLPEQEAASASSVPALLQPLVNEPTFGP
jgi:hypothetical protein